MPQEIKVDQANTAYLRIPFVAVDISAPQTRITQAQILGTWIIKASKNGAAPATPSGSPSPVEIGAADMPGCFYIEVPTANFNTKGFYLLRIASSGGTKIMEPREFHIEVTATDNKDGVRIGITALPNAAAEAAGGLMTRGTGAGQINQDANGRIDVNVVAGVDIDRLLGLAHENSMIDNIVYGDQNIITSARIRHFASAAALASATPGAGNGTDGETRRWLISCTDEGDGQYSDYKISRQL